MWSSARERLRQLLNVLFALFTQKFVVPAYVVMPRSGKRAAFRRRAARLEYLEDREVLSLSYQGGAVLPNVAVETLYYGQAWTQNASLQQDSQHLNQFFSDITHSSYMDLLSEYSTSRQTIGHGQWTGAVYNSSNPPGGTVVSDNQIQAMINSELINGALPPSSANQLIVVFTAPNEIVSLGSQTSASTPGFYGYHGTFTNVYGQQIRYAVIANPTGNDRFPGLSAMDQLTRVASHELAEAVTDPDLNAWFDANRSSPTYGQEVGDLCNQINDTAYLGSYAVQCEWSNRLGGCATPAGATAVPTSTPISTPITSPVTTPVTPVGMPSNLLSLAHSLANSDGAEQKIVTSAYQNYLNRTPDAGGLSYWVGLLRQGATDEQLDAAFIGSQEYIRDHGGNTTAWVEGMYRDLLGRNPDQAGLQYWVRQLASGVQPTSVALGFASSVERETIVVNDDYFSLLGRNANASEASYWVNQLQRGVRNEDILAGFVGSAEYYQDANKGAGNRTTWLESAFHDLLNRAPTAQEISTWLSLMK